MSKNWKTFSPKIQQQSLESSFQMIFALIASTSTRHSSRVFFFSLALVMSAGRKNTQQNPPPPRVE